MRGVERGCEDDRARSGENHGADGRTCDGRCTRGRVRSKTKGRGGDENRAMRGRIRRERKRVTRGTATTTTGGKDETVVKRPNYEAVDAMLANKTTSAWGVPPPPIVDVGGRRRDGKFLGDADLKSILGTAASGAGAGGARWGDRDRRRARRSDRDSFERPGLKDRKTSPRKSPEK